MTQRTTNTMFGKTIFDFLKRIVAPYLRTHNELNRVNDYQLFELKIIGENQKSVLKMTIKCTRISKIYIFQKHSNCIIV